MGDADGGGCGCRPLPKEVVSLVRSGLAIVSVSQCVEELVLNSIDAKATSIIVSVNLDQFNIRVEDDGAGISRAEMEVVGNRYSTSKCHSINDLNSLRFYGYRGEALASVIDVSGTVELISRSEKSSGVYGRKFLKGKARGCVEKLPDVKKKSHGVIIQVGDLLAQIPVRQKRVDKPLQLEEIKSTLQRIALINPSLKFEFRNDSTGTRLFHFPGSSSFSEAFQQLFSSKKGISSVNLIEEHFLHGGFFFMACISRETHRTKDFQFVYVNKRFISRGRIHRYLGQLLGKNFLNDSFKSNNNEETSSQLENANAKKEKYPIFILNIKAPLNCYDITLEPRKMQVEFRDWEVLLKGLDGLVMSFKATLISRDSSKLGIKPKKYIDKSKAEFGREGMNLRSQMEGRSQQDANKTIGDGVTTHDVKRAVHSRFAVRENMSQEAMVTSQQSVISIESSAADSFGMEDMSVSRAGSPSRFTNTRRPTSSMDQNHHNQEQKNHSFSEEIAQALGPKMTLNTTRSKKKVTYELRRSGRGGKRKSSENILPVSNRIYVRPKREKDPHTKSKKRPPQVNADVFQKFPQWEGANQTSTSSPSQSSSVIEMPIRKTKRTPEARKYQTSPPGYSKNLSNLLKKRKLEDESNLAAFNYMEEQKGSQNEDESYKWKLHRYMRQCSESESQLHPVNTPPGAENKSQESRPRSSSSSGSDQSEKMEVTRTTQIEVKVTTSSSALGERRTFFENSQKGGSDSEEVNGNSQELDMRNVWATKIADDSSKKFLSDAGRPPSRKSEDIRADALKGIKTSELGRAFLKQIGIPMEEEESINRSRIQSGGGRVSEPATSTSSGFRVKPFLRPSTFGKGFNPGSGSCQSYSELSQNGSQSVVKPQPVVTIARLSPADLPQQTPDPYGINKLIKGKPGNPHTYSKVRREESKAPLLPPPCDILPSQHSERAGLWEDRMIFETKDNSDVQPEDDNWGQWEVDIVSDAKGDDWLQTEDELGAPLFINLSTGARSYDMVNIVSASQVEARSRKIPAYHIARGNRQFRYNWLRRYFPRSSAQFWKPQEPSERLQLEGDSGYFNKSRETCLGESTVNCIKMSTKGGMPEDNGFLKWRADSLESAKGASSNKESSSYFGEQPTKVPWEKPIEIKEIPVTTLGGPPELKFWNRMKGSHQEFSFRFVKEDLAKVKVLQQLDKKFIVAKISCPKQSSPTQMAEVLVLFDQHAVHERIRLEELMENSMVQEGESRKKVMQRFAIAPPIPLTFTDTEVRMIQSYSEGFEAVGTKIQVVSSTCVTVSSAPKCFAEKVATENIGNREATMRRLLTTLIQEQVHHIIETKGSFLYLPKVVFKIFCSQACHGAIKFGDELELSVCKELIEKLKKCKAPFQCAHGRPALVPLLDLNSLKRITDTRSPLPKPIRETASQAQDCIMFSQPQEDNSEVSSYFHLYSDYFSQELSMSSAFSP